MSSEKGFEPRIVAFLCNWCSYTGADLAGTARMKYPANVRTIRVMCSGRVDAQFVMKAFAEGADAVLISGCHTPSDCHYQEGNFKALRRYYLLKKMLPQFGIEPERLRLEWISAAEGDKFQEVCTEFTEEIKKLGPSPVKKGVKNG
jgi:F420-non-reducing hydrogenase iron-sulfur subunit